MGLRTTPSGRGGDGLNVSEDVGEVPASEFKPESSKRRGVAKPKEEQLGATRIEGEGRRGGATTASIGKSPGSTTESTSRPNWRSSVMYPDIDSWSEAALELCEPFLECSGPSNEENNAGVLGVRDTSGWTYSETGRLQVPRNGDRVECGPTSSEMFEGTSLWMLGNCGVRGLTRRSMAVMDEMPLG
jgi:hypothetical protein